MIRSSACLQADDISIRCRVRRSPFATNPKFGETQEVTCTMRHWEAKDSPSHPIQKSPSSASNPDSRTLRMVQNDNLHFGPELLFTPLQPIISTRDDSPVRRSRMPQVIPEEHHHAYSIPVIDIMVVETHNVRFQASNHKLHITTLTLGYFEIDCCSRNAHDILLAFFQATLAPERILDGGAMDRDFLQSKSSASSCFDMDVDALTAQYMQGHAARETWPEKFSRRVGKVVTSLTEISDTLCAMSCCDNTSMTQEVRDEPPKQQHLTYNDLEMDEGDHSTAYSSPERTSTFKTESKARLRFCHLPSGLSVEQEEQINAR